MNTDVTMEKIISLCKRRGFVFPGSEIYGGLAGTWDYGPFGVELKNNIKQLWWRMFVQDRDDMVGVVGYSHESEGVGSVRACQRIYRPGNRMYQMWKQVENGCSY